MDRFAQHKQRVSNRRQVKLAAILERVSPETSFRKYRRAKRSWAQSIKVGDIVCDCRYKHMRVVQKFDFDDVKLEDGAHCSLIHCCDPVTHTWSHNV